MVRLGTAPAERESSHASFPDVRRGPNPPRAHDCEPLETSHAAHHAVSGGPRDVRPSPGPAVDAQRRAVGALLLLRDARHPAVLHHRHRGQRGSGPKREQRPGRPGLLQRGRVSTGDPRRHLRRPRHRPLAIDPLRGRRHHGRSPVPVDPRERLLLAGHRPGRHRHRLHQAEPVDDRGRTVRQGRSASRHRFPDVLHVDQHRFPRLAPGHRLAAVAPRIPRRLLRGRRRHGSGPRGLHPR